MITTTKRRPTKPLPRLKTGSTKRKYQKVGEIYTYTASLSYQIKEYNAPRKTMNGSKEYIIYYEII